MKQKAKNAFKHRVEVAGKTIPTMIIIGLFMAGSGSAALLATYGSVSGSATVNQAVTVSESTSFSTSIAGGALVENSFVVRNHANETAEAVFSTTYSPDGQGLDTTYVVTSRWAVDDNKTGDSALENDSSDNVQVTASSENVADGSYSLHFDSVAPEEDGNDYAIAWYPVSSSVSESDSITYTGKKLSGDNPLDDEVWLVSSDGELYWTNSASTTGTSGSFTTVTYDFDRSDSDENSWYRVTDSGSNVQVNPDFSSIDVAAVGVGQGSPSKTTGDYTVDVVVDDVKVAGNSVDEVHNPSVELLPTGSYNDGFLNKHYNVSAVTDVQINVQPDTYTIDTSVTPPSEKTP